MFFGSFEFTLDAKNRLFVPKKFLEAIDSVSERQSFFLMRGLDRCLFLYCKSSWDDVVAELRSRTSLGQPNARAFSRLLFASVEQVNCDKQGRIVVSEKLKAAAGIDRDVVVVGVDRRMEVWDRASWSEFEGQKLEGYEQFAAELLDGASPSPPSPPPSSS